MNPIWCGVERVVIVKAQQLSFTRGCGKCRLRSQLSVYNIQRNVDTRARGTGDGGSVTVLCDASYFYAMVSSQCNFT